MRGRKTSRGGPAPYSRLILPTTERKIKSPANENKSNLKRSHIKQTGVLLTHGKKEMPSGYVCVCTSGIAFRSQTGVRLRVDTLRRRDHTTTAAHCLQTNQQFRTSTCDRNSSSCDLYRQVRSRTEALRGHTFQAPR